VAGRRVRRALAVGGLRPGGSRGAIGGAGVVARELPGQQGERGGAARR
jgi:hypothetical protein